MPEPTLQLGGKSYSLWRWHPIGPVVHVLAGSIADPAFWQGPEEGSRSWPKHKAPGSGAAQPWPLRSLRDRTIRWEDPFLPLYLSSLSVTLTCKWMNESLLAYSLWKMFATSFCTILRNCSYKQSKGNFMQPVMDANILVLLLKFYKLCEMCT